MDEARFTGEAARRVDAEVIDDWGLPGLVLMENAAAGLALVVGLLAGRCIGK